MADDQKNSSSDRATKQQARLRKKIMVDAVEAAAQLQVPPPQVPQSIADSSPPIVAELRESHGRYVRQQVQLLGVEEEEGVKFVESIMSQIGSVRSRNKKLLALSNRITARLDVAASNCLFKLASCRVTVQPRPTPGWNWIMGTLGDDEFHAFRKVGSSKVLDANNPPAGVALNICYEAGCAGDVDKIFGFAVLTRANALGTRFEVLAWNHRLTLLDALIDKVAALEPPSPLGELELAALVLDDAEAGGASSADIPPSAILRRDREILVEEMLASCEHLSALEAKGADYSKPNRIICECMARLPKHIQRANAMLRQIQTGLKAAQEAAEPRPSLTEAAPPPPPAVMPAVDLG